MEGCITLLITVLPADLGNWKAASSVTGFIDAMGYLGAGLNGVGTGYLVERFGWNAGLFLDLWSNFCSNYDLIFMEL